MAADEAEKAVVFYVGARRLVALAGEILPGGMRVLLQETQPENGRRKFTIVDIAYRKDVYRKRRI